jgi:hypothetical protein
MSTRRIRRAHARRSRVAAATGTALGASVLAVPVADAATFTVTSLADNGAEGTLREQIEDANAALGDDVIVFQSGLSGTIELQNEDIEILQQSLDIQGPGADVITIDSSDSGRAFELSEFSADEAVSISGLTLADGSIQSPGGAVYAHGAAGDPAALTIADSVVRGNFSQTAGGAIAVNGGSLTVTESTFVDNHTDGSGGAIFIESAPLTITNAVISGNSADGGGGDGGGGVYLGGGGGDVVIADTTISDNEASNGSGGGVAVDNPATALDSLTIVGSTIARNRADEDGGAIKAWRTEGPVSVLNTTISGNEAGLRGGAIYFYSNLPSSRTVQNSTVVDNSAGEQGGGIYVFQEGGLEEFNEGDTVNLSSTIVARNDAADAEPDLGQTSPPDMPPEAFVAGFSLVGDPSGATLAESPSGSNIFDLDPQLGALAGNGGPTQTHLPALTSPVIDHGVANGLGTDQRGFARTGDLSAIPSAAGSDATDIGAVEIQVGACQGANVPSIDGTAGDDTLTGTDGADAIFGLAGNDTSDGGAANDCVSGDEGNDSVKGGAGKDQVSGGAGKDRASGNGGKDRVKGQAGKDNLKGGGGKDRLSGQGGKDTLKGGGGKDRLKGGPGKDKLVGGGGKDRFDCGGGKDKVTAQAKDKVSASCEKVIERG